MTSKRENRADFALLKQQIHIVCRNQKLQVDESAIETCANILASADAHNRRQTSMTPEERERLEKVEER